MCASCESGLVTAMALQVAAALVLVLVALPVAALLVLPMLPHLLPTPP